MQRNWFGMTLVGGLLLAAGPLMAQAQPLGTAFTYQAVIQQNGAPLDGTADFRFTLWDSATHGTQIGAQQSLNNVAITAGLLTQTIDFGAAALNGDSRWLQIALRAPAGSGSFTTLAPRQALTGVPYALQTRGIFVDANENVGIGTSAPAKPLHVAGGDFLVDRGTAVSSLTRNVSIGGARESLGNDYAQLDLRNYDQGSQAVDYVGARISSRNDGSDDGDLRFSVASDGVLALQMMLSKAGNVGIGTSTPGFPLTFANTSGDKISLYGQSGAHYGFGVQNFLLQIHGDVLGADIAFGYGSSAAFTERMRIKGTGNVGIGTTNPQNTLHIVRNADTFALEGADHTYMEFFPDGLAAGRKGHFGFATAASDNLVLNNETTAGHLILRGNGNVGINFPGNGAPAADLDVNGATKTTTLEVTDEAVLPNGVIRRGGATPATNDLGLYALTSGNWLRLVTNNSPIQFFTDSTDGTAATPPANSAAMTIAANGNIGLGLTAPSADLHVIGNDTVTASFESAMTDGTWVNFRNTSTGGRRWNVISTGSTHTAGAGKLLFRGESPPNVHMVLDGAGNVGIGTYTPAAKLDVAGIARVDTLQIDAGADVAENYDVAAALTAMDAAPAPGMVVSIDPRMVGKLIVADQPFDRRVAGIISGAGDVKPGLVLSQPGTVADGAHAVASIGRVWCWADAEAGGPIDAGDMLTTSATAGHAMRVSDPSQAVGAIIGKAMSRLDKGRGLVLVLVNLQ